MKAQSQILALELVGQGGKGIRHCDTSIRGAIQGDITRGPALFIAQPRDPTVLHDVKLERAPAREHLSDVEAALLDEIWGEHGSKDQWQLVDWCHAHCKEWTPVTNGCAPIAVEQIGMALGKTPQQIHRLRQEAVELNRLDEIFTPA